MEFYEVRKLNDWYLAIKLPYIDRTRLSYSQRVGSYNYYLRRYSYSYQTDYLYQEEVEDGVFTYQIGFAEVLLREFGSKMTQESRQLLEDIIYSDHDEDIYFPNLFINQNDDLNQLLRYNRGLFQCYTGYGKSEVIATLANYLEKQGKVVLIVTASDNALKEIKSRLFKLFGTDLDYFDEERSLNAINTNGYLKSSWYNPNSTYWLNDFIILADEVENCVSETAMEFYESLHFVSRMYGFSATTDKKEAESMSLSNYDADNSRDIISILGRNKYLVGYYGPSAVFRLPDHFDIDLINVQTTISDDDIEIPEEYEYNEVIYDLFTSDKVCVTLERICSKLDLVYIPMFRLQVIDHWIDNYFKFKDYVIAVISSRGYELYENGEFIDYVSLEDLKLLIHNGSINLILGTKSSYNALDFPELNKVILLYSKAANVVIQAIGRSARGKKFSVYNLLPIKPIPTYSSDLAERFKLIKQYYRYCNIKELTINENVY